jgi:hypothetical protein
LGYLCSPSVTALTTILASTGVGASVPAVSTSATDDVYGVPAAATAATIAAPSRLAGLAGLTVLAWLAVPAADAETTQVGGHALQIMGTLMEFDGCGGGRIHGRYFIVGSS